MEILELKTDEALADGYLVLKELRTELGFEDFISIYREAHGRDQYRLFGAVSNNQCLAVMGCRILFDYVHGKHLYIDDLVVTSTQRSSGVGAKLLQFAEALAKDNGCSRLRLSTGTANMDARRFYEKNSWELRSVTYKKTLV